jgi:hypothetical protein
MKRTLATVATTVDRWLDGTSFPPIAWNDRDRRRIEFVRVAVGVLMIWRVALILDSTRYYFGPPHGWLGLGGGESRFALVELALAVSVLVGFLTPICLVALILTIHRFDTVTLTPILGSSVLIHTLVILLISGVGTQMSIDSVLARGPRRRIAFGTPIRHLYRMMGYPTPTAVRTYLFLGFMAYGVLSFGAILNHIADAYWRSGDTIRVTLQNSYLSRVWGWARSLESAHPAVLAAFSQFCNLGQGLFQLLMGLLIRWRWGYRFVIWWGVAFFLFSLILLQLSFLPHFELCLWVLVFARSKVDQPAAADGRELDSESDRPATQMMTNGPIDNPLRTRPRSASATGVLICSLSMVCFLAVLTLPQTKRGVDSVVGINLDSALDHVQPGLGDFLAAAGMTPPNVFNAVDLRMGDAWPVIYRVEPNGSLEMVPFSARDGSRLWYHVSDVAYIGNSVRWRRAMIDADIRARNQPGTPGYELIEKILLYDYRRLGRSEPLTYRVDLFVSHASRLDVPIAERFTQTLVYSYTETIME